jgi:hypothetical protein
MDALSMDTLEFKVGDTVTCRHGFAITEDPLETFTVVKIRYSKFDIQTSMVTVVTESGRTRDGWFARRFTLVQSQPKAEMFFD